MIDPAAGAAHTPLTRFEHPRPNDLWQMDFKGHFGLRCGTRCHPLTVLDDHSRFCIGLRACADERGPTVQQELTAIFRRYGLPWRMVMDNGSPWGGEGDFGHTPLTVWLLRLGIGVTHGRAYHPQTQGKDERFHRTLKLELLSRRTFADHRAGQRGFDAWRDQYNLVRPHDALDLDVPASRYQVSTRVFPEVLPAIEYPSGDQVRVVGMHGRISYRGRTCKVPKALRGEPVAVRPTPRDGVLDVYYCQTVIATLDLTSPPDAAPPRTGSARCARGTAPRRGDHTLQPH
jgi:hypothetical protein